MNCIFRKSPSFSLVLRTCGELSGQTLRFSYVRRLGVPLLVAKANNFCTRKDERVEALDSVCHLLRRTADWDRLDASFGSVQLSSTLIDDVLLSLKEPVDARKALGFFHWCSRRRDYQHCVRSYCLIIHVLLRARLLLDARALLESVILKNSGSETSIVETLVCTYEEVLSCPEVFDYLIQTYAKLRMFEIAFRAIAFIGEHGFLLSLISLNTLLQVVQRSDQNDLVWKIYEYMIVKRIYPNHLTVEIMTNSMCKGGILVKVVDVLDRIHGKRCSPAVLVNTALTLRIIEENRVGDGITLLKRMLQKNMILDDVACSMTVYAYCKVNNLQMAYTSYDIMLKRGHCMNSIVCTSLIGLLCKKGNAEDAICLLNEMLLAGVNPYDETYNVLIEWCSKLGKLEQSLAFYNQMLDRGLLPSCRAVTEMTGQLCKAGNVKCADDILTILLDKGFTPDELIYCHIIDGFGSAGKFQDVLKLYHEMEWRWPSLSLAVYTSVVRSLCECERLKEAKKILTVMRRKSVVPSREIYELISRASQKMRI